ncbi:hypothetical protein K1T71_012099 [Dendrolimus kikuchii]|uniref:Uncharacterized protein n=1 Tax=Dendrolimus kikuchii TaxID=765133 RepID=A0ACC1CKL1_9NEOP|nr:hypothetical protein K1T71_012099 [Dendrolimus kikuchii]
MFYYLLLFSSEPFSCLGLLGEVVMLPHYHQAAKCFDGVNIGLFNVSFCQYDSPVVPSLLLGGPLDAVEGISPPVPEKHRLIHRRRPT